MSLTRDQAEYIERAGKVLTLEDAATVIGQLVEIPSPTGQELPLAEFLCARAGASGLDTQTQLFGAQHANAVVAYGPESERPGLLLFSPIDTHVDTSDGGFAWSSDDQPPELRARATRVDDFVLGLGANNPKGHAAAVLLAMEALAATEVPLDRRVVGGFAGGGMPWGRLRSGGTNSELGHGSGCRHLLAGGPLPDAAVIAKPGAPSREEVGLLWARIRVAGQMDYVGIRPRWVGPSPVVVAARLVEQLDTWFPHYTARHAAGTLAPQGAVGAVLGGVPDRVAFSPASCEIHVDLRLHPDTSPADALSELSEAVAVWVAEWAPVEVTTSMEVAIPGSATPPDAPIVQACIRAWEAVHDATYVPQADQSGATDANVLRAHGIPTARVGMPVLPHDAPLTPGFGRSMNVVDLRAVLLLARVLIHATIQTCGTQPSN